MLVGREVHQQLRRRSQEMIMFEQKFILHHLYFYLGHIVYCITMFYIFSILFFLEQTCW